MKISSRHIDIFLGVACGFFAGATLAIAMAAFFQPDLLAGLPVAFIGLANLGAAVLCGMFSYAAIFGEAGE